MNAQNIRITLNFYMANIAVYAPCLMKYYFAIFIFPQNEVQQRNDLNVIDTNYTFPCNSSLTDFLMDNSFYAIGLNENYVNAQMFNQNANL